MYCKEYLIVKVWGLVKFVCIGGIFGWGILVVGWGVKLGVWGGKIFCGWGRKLGVWVGFIFCEL